MNASELIQRLQTIVTEHGDLPIGGGYIHDNSGIRNVFVLDKDGCNVAHTTTRAHTIYLEG